MTTLQNTNSELVSTALTPFRVSIDWFAFTFYDPEFSDAEQLFAFRLHFPFIENVFSKNPRVLAASNHFEYMIRITDGVCLSWDVNCSKGVNLSVSGSHLGLFYEWFPEISVSDMHPFRKLIYILKSNCCRPSRVDIAFDDFDKVYRPVDFNNYNFQDRIVTPYRSGFLAHNRCTGACTFQLGKRSSGSHLRIYDKDIESNGEVDAVRYEFELHGSTCRDFCDMYATYGALNFKDFFMQRLNVLCEDDAVKYKRNKKSDPEWINFLKSKFIDFFVKLEIMPRKIDCSPEKAMRNAINHLKGVIMYCHSIPKDVLWHLFEELKYNFTDRDFEKMKLIDESLSRFLNYDFGDVI